jgi:hypothetical protein
LGSTLLSLPVGRLCDISKAFDAIYHSLLLEQISNSELHSNIVRWLAAYIRGRSATCVYSSAMSSPLIVPQGSVLSPALFNFFVSDCPAIADILESYADDFTVLESDSDLAALNRKLQDSLTPIVEWALRKKLTIAPSKSQVTLFTPWSKQYKTRPDVSIDNVDVPLNQFPKILGVTFDPQFTFQNHIINIAAKCSQHLNLLKAVCGTSWGHDKQTLLITYKALVESVMSYAAAVW